MPLGNHPVGVKAVAVDFGAEFERLLRRQNVVIAAAQTEVEQIQSLQAVFLGKSGLQVCCAGDNHQQRSEQGGKFS